MNIAYTISINSATRERASSAMRWVNNWLCSTISQNCFSNLALSIIEKDLTNTNNTIDSDTTSVRQETICKTVKLTQCKELNEKFTCEQK